MSDSDHVDVDALIEAARGHIERSAAIIARSEEGFERLREAARVAQQPPPKLRLIKGGKDA